MSELEKLIQEKKELERRIGLLTKGTVIMESVKLDTIHAVGGNTGKWAVSVLYSHIARIGYASQREMRKKWVPIVCCDNREEAVMRIPEIIKALNELYEKAGGEDAKI